MVELVKAWREEAGRLRGRYGDDVRAGIFETCANDLEAAMAAWENETLTVAEAAVVARVNEETVRRAVRVGDIEDLREGGQGHMRIRRKDAEKLKGRGRGRRSNGGDPVGDLLRELTGGGG